MQMDFDTSHAVWAAYFVICDIGTGSATNLPYNTVSTVFEEADMVTGNDKPILSLNLGVSSLTTW
jgi:hypothetical protein